MLLVSSGRSNPRGRRVSPSTKHQAFSARRCPPPQIFQRTATRALAALPNSPWCCSVQAEGKSGRSGRGQPFSCCARTKQVPFGSRELAPYPQPPLYPALRLEAQEETAALVLLHAACCLTPIIYSKKETWTKTRQS